MRKSYRFFKQNWQDSLHKELDNRRSALGLPYDPLMTLRGSVSSPDGEIWHDGLMTDAQIQEVISAHGQRAKSRIEVLRDKRRAGENLTAAEQQELLDLLLGV